MNVVILHLILHLLDNFCLFLFVTDTIDKEFLSEALNKCGFNFLFQYVFSVVFRLHVCGCNYSFSYIIRSI